MQEKDNLLTLLFGDENGPMLRIAFTALAAIPPEKWRDAITALNKHESIMPLIDPSAWLDGKRFDNVKAYKEIFQLALPLSIKLQQSKEKEKET